MKDRCVNLILALYPRAWRRRYADELTQLLDDLNGKQPRSQLRQVLDLLLNAPPIHIAYRPIASSILAFCLGGAIATVLVPGDVSTTKQAPFVATTKQAPIVATQRASGRQLLIIREPHGTIITHDPRATGTRISTPVK